MKRTRPISRLAGLLLALALAVSPAAALTAQDAGALLEEYYVDPIDPAVLAQPTVEEMLDALGDPYTEYLSEAEYTAFLASMADGAAGGVGITSTETDQGLLISEVAEGSPAQAAGLQAGDVIIAVDGQDVVALGSDAAVALIRGEVGTPVRLTYLRQGLRQSATMTRAQIVIPATDGAVLAGGVGYIDCDTWGEDTPAHFRQLIGDMEPSVGCWLIDLRQNGGGLTDAAAEVAGLFCGQGTMVSLRLRERGADGQMGHFYRPYIVNGAPMTQKPVVVLVDGYTASASESFAAALRDYGRAVVVGERTYGKGVAQALLDESTYPEFFDGDCLKLTMARFYSPLGNTNDTIGVIPTFPVSPEKATDFALDLAADLAQDPEGWGKLCRDRVDAYRGEFLFPDVPADDPYGQAAATLAAYGMAAGKGDGLFHPADALTRAELAQLLLGALNCWIAEEGNDFTDVPPEAWYADAVTAVTDMGWMEGTGAGRFSPEATLTHQELFTVLGRLGRWLNDELGRAAQSFGEPELGLRVLEDYDDWAKPSVWLLSCGEEDGEGTLVNFLWDRPEYIDPTAPATRAETAWVLYSLLYYLTILP